jgi:DNA-binding phage protein
LMPESTSSVAPLLQNLSVQARERGLNDAAWCRAAGIRKETLSRLRKRSNCDFATLAALADAVGARIGLLSASPVELTSDGLFPASVDRDYEQRLADLVASKDFDPNSWRLAGPAFFMAGLAVLAASVSGLDRRRLLEVAEHLHPGSTRTEVLSLWLERSPVRPSRFAPMIRQRSRNAA